MLRLIYFLLDAGGQCWLYVRVVKLCVEFRYGCVCVAVVSNIASQQEGYHEYHLNKLKYYLWCIYCSLRTTEFMLPQENGSLQK